jgi:acetyl esterase/lipase
MRVSPLCGALALLACGGDGTGPGASGSEAIDVVRSCSVPPVPSAAQVNLATDVTYATMGGQPVRLDVAWPRAGTAARPIVLVFHGGAWSDGDKTAQRGDILLLAERGFVAASVNYRLADAPDNTFPAAVADARCAVRWMRQHAADYGGDGARVAALGYSAGAHLAALLGTASDVAGLDDACPLAGSPRVERVIAFYGPHDLRPNGSLAGFQQQIIANFLGAPASSVPDEAALASPVVHASADDSPTLLVHGRSDFIVPIESSRLLRDALQDAGARATLVEVGAGHGFGAFTPSLPPSACTTLAFLDQMREP